MPKVRPLTREMREKQADEEAVEHISRRLLEQIGAERGRMDITKEEMADFLGVTRTSICNWKRHGLAGVSLGRVVSMARKLGYHLELREGI